MIKRILLGVAMAVTATMYARDTAPATDTGSKEHSESADLFFTAGQLVRYGYRTKTALPLIQAAEIYNHLGVTNQPKEKTSEGSAVTESSLIKGTDVAYDPAKLLADAAEYADGNRNLLALIKAAGETRGRVGPGNRGHYDRVKANTTDVYTWPFKEGEQVIIAVSGDGDTDLDLFVYDSDDNLVAWDIDPGDDCLVMFTPRRTGTFRVKVKNYGTVYNNYVIATN